MRLDIDRVRRGRVDTPQDMYERVRVGPVEDAIVLIEVAQIPHQIITNGGHFHQPGVRVDVPNLE